VLHEGRKRQVRRMCEAVGHAVRTLHRSAYAGLGLGDLAPGEWRELTHAEVAALRAATRTTQVRR
jgi:23S rRNA pseudouridine2605 synthase